MKKTHSTSFTHGRRALITSALVALLGTAPAFAQAGGADTSYGSSQKNPPADTSTSTTGSTANEATRRESRAQSIAAENADVISTREINAQTSAATGRDKLSWGDRRFVTKAADGGQAKLQLAQLAAQRATSTEVRNFAQKLVDDHSTANSELITLASQKNVKVDFDDDQDRAYKRLNKKSGSEFDQEFVENMIDEHEKDIKMFEKASTDAKDPEVRSFAANHISHEREHLQAAQSLRQTLMPTGRIDDASGRSTPDATTEPRPSTSPGTSSSSSDTSTTTRPNGSR